MQHQQAWRKVTLLPSPWWRSWFSKVEVGWWRKIRCNERWSARKLQQQKGAIEQFHETPQAEAPRFRTRGVKVLYFFTFCHMIKNINRYGISWYYFRARSPTQIQTWSFIQSQVSTCGRNVFITQRKKYWNLTSNICRMLSERSGFRCVLSGAFTPALGAVRSWSNHRGGRMLLPGLNRAGEAKSCRVSVLLAAF